MKVEEVENLQITWTRTDLILRPHVYQDCVWETFSMPPSGLFISQQTSENECLPLWIPAIPPTSHFPAC